MIITIAGSFNIKFYAEMDTTDFRLEPGENIEENKKNLMIITQKVFNAIVNSAHKYVHLLLVTVLILAEERGVLFVCVKNLV